MKKTFLLVFIMILSSFSIAGTFLSLGTYDGLGVGYTDQSNYLRISMKDMSFSSKVKFFNHYEAYLAVNFLFNKPVENNNLGAGLRIISQNFSLDGGFWNSFFDKQKVGEDEIIGQFGMKIGTDINVNNLLAGVALNYAMMNVTKNESGLNYYIQALPIELGFIRGFSGYVGYRLFSKDDFKTDFIINFSGKYSVIPGGMVFYKISSNNDINYSFSLKVDGLRF